MKHKNSTYRLITEQESSIEEGMKNICLARDILFDVKYLIKAFYTAAFTKAGDGLLVRFSTGAVFLLRVEEIKDGAEIVEPEREPERCFCEHSEIVLMDLKYLLQDFYTVTYAPDGSGLMLRLGNGQRFKLAVLEIPFETVTEIVVKDTEGGA